MDTPSPEALQPFLDELNATMCDRTEWGRGADCIPEFADLPVKQFVISVALPDGRVLSTGQNKTFFSI